LAVTESWGRPCLTDALLIPPGYIIFRKDRNDRQGGGVFVLVREELKPVSFPLPDNLTVYEDSVWTTFRVHSKSLLLGCIYRSPSSSLINNESLTSIFECIGQSNFDFKVIVGDFNSPDIDWKMLDASTTCRFLLDCSLDNFLTQLVDTPTRGNHILDLMFVNDPSFVSSVLVNEPFPGSDHSTVHCCMQFDVPQPCTKKQTSLQPFPKFNFNKADWPLYRSVLDKAPWETILSCNDVETTWEMFKSQILCAAEAAIPRLAPSRKVHGVPLTGSVRHAFRNRKQIMRSLRGSTSPLATELRARADEKLNNAIVDSRRTFELAVANDCNHNPKRFWGAIRSSLGSKPKTTSVLDSSGYSTHTDEATAQSFNNFFASVFSIENSDDPLPCLQPRTRFEFTDFLIRPELVSKAIETLGPFSSPGPDGIVNVLLKKGGQTLIMAIVSFFRFLLQEGALPSEWKLAYIVPIFKNGSRSDCKNYRPISLTCSLCKLFERLLADAMMIYLLRNDLLDMSQHGFLPRRSCSTALIAFLEYVSSSVDDKKSVDAIYLDFSKAFDSVPHKRLILRLRSYGFGGPVLKWITSFLTNRQQQVTVGYSLSSALPVTSGVPQGSVLGPLLFILYINDIDSGLSSNIIKFADDIRLYLDFVTPDTDKVCHTTLQDDLLLVTKWCDTWMLKLNTLKCKSIHFGFNNPRNTYCIDDDTIPAVHSITDLGITISDDLKPSSQCRKVASKAHRMLSMIKLAFHYLDVTSLTMLYKAFVLPILDYCSVVWSPYFIKDIEILERVQRRFTRILPVFRHLSYRDRLTKYGLSSLHARRLAADLTCVFKIFHGFTNIDPSYLFQLNVDSRTRGHSQKLRVCQTRLDARKHFFSSRIIAHWNSLPNKCIAASTVGRFKSELWRHFASEGIY
jgi:hypothetical protein